MGKQLELLLFLLFLVGGCAQSRLLLDRNLLIPFEEFAEKSKFKPGSQAVSLAVIDERDRDRKELLGMAKTGARYKDTPLIVPGGVKQFVKDYYLKEMSERGFVFSDQSSTLIELVVKNLWVDELQEKFKGERAKCHVEIELYAKKGPTSFKARYWAKITSAGNLGDGTDHIAPTLASCLNLSIEKMAKDNKFTDFLN